MRGLHLKIKEIQQVFERNPFSIVSLSAPEPMHLRTAVETLDGLTWVDNRQQMIDKRAKSIIFQPIDEI